MMDRFLVEYIDATYYLAKSVAQSILTGNAERLNYALSEAETKRSRFISNLEHISSKQDNLS